MIPATTYFDLSLQESTSTIAITLHIQGDKMTTAHMPYLQRVLKGELPTILRAKCFNEKDIPFHKEVLCTELGHLFEHILLEYLCIAKIRIGCQEAIFSGITKWDWNKDPYGTFHIDLDIEKDDVIFLTLALQKTTHLFQKILLLSMKETTHTIHIPLVASSTVSKQQIGKQTE